MKGFLSPQARYYCELLGVTPEADKEFIKRKYRAAAKRHHPDRNRRGPYTERRFEDILTAYKVLTNPSELARINKEFLSRLRSEVAVGGRVFDIGSFFGIRSYRDAPGGYYRPGYADTAGLIRTRERPLNPTPREEASRSYPLSAEVMIHECSVLDDPAWDILEIFLGGVHDEKKKRIIQEAYDRGGLEALEETPWARKNIDGFYAFCMHEFRAAKDCFDGLIEEIPRNIIFSYRAGLCTEALAFVPEGEGGPEFWERGKLIRRAIRLYKQAIRIGEEREPGESQKCLTVRKALAELYEASGRGLRARWMWKSIARMRPRSAGVTEALRRLKLTRALNPFARVPRHLRPAPPGDRTEARRLLKG